MNNEIRKERIGVLKNEMSHLWNSFIATFGGSIAMLINSHNPMGFIFSAAGLFLAFVIFNAYFIRRKEIEKLIRLMERL